MPGDEVVEDELLAGPRGRRFLAELAEWRLAPEERWSLQAWAGLAMGRHSGDDLPSDLRGACLEQLQQLVDRVDLHALVGVRWPEELLEPLAASVDSARYWQDVDAIDGVLADPRAVEVLRPLVAPVLAAPATAWWRDDVDRGLQQHVDWLWGSPAGRQAPVLTGGRRALRDQREEETVREAQERREHPGLARAPWSGAWWSSPSHVEGVVATSPVLEPPRSEEVLPVGLALVEDASDDGRAVLRPLRARSDARVLEIHSARAWCDLVEAHPREVTWSRGLDWQLSTGWAGSWVLPDWASVAREWDGVHLSVLGHLGVSGRLLTTTVTGEQRGALAPGPARTLLAGWSPGQTFWLTDALEAAGDAQRWGRDEQWRGDLGWSLAEEGGPAEGHRPRLSR
ncbi:hypothetical protein [uncultured Pseudokineococcus sp.]|uniref:hypothetical protein n=1 Tax=uncultured Pseudokineococcus sp. TaxID=1642928 RepID=UPI002609F69E|nr:hypothetical protein [uncultured Pseudokineococcus sp.]